MKNTNKKMRWALSLLITAVFLAVMWALSFTGRADTPSHFEHVGRLIHMLFGMNPEWFDLVKVAHLLQYALLGAWLMVVLWINDKVHFQNIVNMVYVGGTAGLVDECLQLFNNRGSVTNIVADVAGVVLGIAIVGAVRAIVRGLRD